MRRRNASGYTHLAAVCPHPADESLLHDILGVGHGAEHAVGDAHELWTQRVETRRCVRCILGRCIRHQAAFASMDFIAVRSANTPNPTAMRFHTLVTLISNVSLTCSSAVK